MTTQIIPAIALSYLAEFIYKKEFVQWPIHVELLLPKNPHSGKTIVEIKRQLCGEDAMNLVEILHEWVNGIGHPRYEGPGVD